jgi:NitT/TauT family transport system ATP-binding protein
LDVVSGLARPAAGEIYMDGRRLTRPTAGMGFIMQGYALFPWRTVRKNVEFALAVQGTPKRFRKGIVERYIELVGLNGFEERYPRELSGGMRQRVAIARALACDPQALLMDEPFAAVDAQTRETLQDELMEIWARTKKTVIFITHSIEEAVLLADRVVVMTPRPGRIKRIVDIRLPRPRTSSDMRVSMDFRQTTHRVWSLLRGEDDEARPKPPEKPKANVAEEIDPAASL